MKVAEVGFAACAGRARSGGREGSTCAGNGAHGGCVQLLKDGKMMKQQTMPRRLLCAVCAVVLLVLAVPAAWAAEPDADTAAPVQSLTASEATEMQQADAAVTALTDSADYAAMSAADRKAAALEQLDDLVQQGLVAKGSIYADEENGMVSFSYSCGALGGILLEDPDEENTAADLQLAEAAQQTAQNGTYGTAMLYYAFDDTVNSSRYPNYAYMQSYWTSVGLDTKLDTTVTVADLRRMNNYDLCVLSTHGAYYTYEYGWLWKRTATAPVLLLTEKSTFWNDLRYGMDLLNHRIIKVNGAYAVTAGFFRAAYRSGALKDTIILSETCEFYGKSGHLDTSMADALLSGGAACVVGYVNNVYTVYSRSMLWATVNRLLAGDTVRKAVDFGLNLYGADDIIWYNNQGGRRPHAVASFPVLSGNQNARLRAVQAAADSTQQAA